MTAIERQELGESSREAARGSIGRFSLRQAAALVAPFLVAFAVYAAVLHVSDPSPTGDEPHYLLVAQSIAYDRDVSLANDYASRSRTLRAVGYFPFGSYLHAGIYTSSGELRPTHGVGLSALIAPAVALGGETAVRWFMVLIAALLAQQLFLLLRDLGISAPWRIAAWAAAVFCLPVLAFSSQIYPELPGALLVVIALRVMLRGASSPIALLAGSAAGALLVWLQVRYLPIAAGLFLGLAYVATSGDRPGASAPSGSLRKRLAADLNRRAKIASRNWRTVTVPVVAPYLVSFVLFELAFQRWYGSFSPGAPYALFYDNTFGSSGWGFLYHHALSDLFQPAIGWIPYVPVHWLGLAALGCLLVRFRWFASAGLAVAVAYELALASADLPGGWQHPARYLLIVIPLIALPLAVALQYAPASRILFVPLLAVSLVVGAAAVRDPLWLYPVAAKPRLPGLEQVADAYPSPRELGFPTSFVDNPGQFAPQTGVLSGGKVVAKGQRDRPGFLIWGPYAALEPGPYRATFSLAATGASGNTPVATIEVVGGPPTRTFAQRALSARQLEQGAPLITLPFTTPGGYLTETRVYYHGNGTLVAGPVQVERAPNAPVGRQRIADWQLALLWIAITILVGWFLVKTMRPVATERTRDTAGRSAP